MGEPRVSDAPKSTRKKPVKNPAESADSKTPDPRPAEKKRRLRMPKFLRTAGSYFKNSWLELRYTKWPNRRSTWSLTLAVIIFTAFIMLFMVGVDYVFDALFQRLIL